MFSFALFLLMLLLKSIRGSESVYKMPVMRVGTPEVSLAFVLAYLVNGGSLVLHNLVLSFIVCQLCF